jgi:V/A-type H+-transporting ATPase subunit I
VVFGSVFSVEGIVAPVWLHPLEHPLPVLLAPIIGGAVLLVVGLLIAALEAWWEGRFDQWLRSEAALLLTFGGCLAALSNPVWAWIAVAGIATSVVPALLEQRAPSAAFKAVGELFEHTVQLLINTLSFARVGAFALAHAGLSSAVVALAQATDHALAGLVVLVVGNALILVVEGLVVSIQTTRLVLFEFFTRFMRPEGREFRPLAPPPVTLAA